jgi:hypothetical protein
MHSLLIYADKQTFIKKANKKAQSFSNLKTIVLMYLNFKSENKKAPPVGLEPTTLRLTAACSTD